MSIIESNWTDNDLFVKYDDFDLDDELKGLTEHDLDIDTEDEIIKHSVEEMNMPIIESNRTDNDLFDDDEDDDDFDLDDEWKELTKCHSDIDTEDEMIEDKIDDGRW